MPQEAFPFYKYKSEKEAKAARDQRYKELKASGHNPKRWVLENQLIKYARLGVPDGRIGKVYMINYR